MKIYMVKKAKDRKIKESIDLLGEAKDHLKDSLCCKKNIKKI